VAKLPSSADAGSVCSTILVNFIKTSSIPSRHIFVHVQHVLPLIDQRKARARLIYVLLTAVKGSAGTTGPESAEELVSTSAQDSFPHNRAFVTRAEVENEVAQSQGITSSCFRTS
jgi:hypothetical protein